MQEVSDAEGARPSEVLRQFPASAHPDIAQGLRENVPRLQEAKRRLRNVGREHAVTEQARLTRNLDLLAKAWGNVAHAYTPPAYRVQDDAGVGVGPPAAPGMNAVSNLASITRLAEKRQVQNLEELWDGTKPHGVLAHSLPDEGRVCTQLSTKAALASLRALPLDPQQDASLPDRPTASPSQASSHYSPEVGRGYQQDDDFDDAASDHLELAAPLAGEDGPSHLQDEASQSPGPVAAGSAVAADGETLHGPSMACKRRCSPDRSQKPPKRQNTTPSLGLFPPARRQASSAEPLSAARAPLSSPTPLPPLGAPSPFPEVLPDGSPPSAAPRVNLEDEAVTVDSASPVSEARQDVTNWTGTPAVTAPRPASPSSKDDRLQRIRGLVMDHEESVRRLARGHWYDGNIMSSVMQLLAALEPSKWMAIDPLVVSRGTESAPLAQRLTPPDEERHIGLLFIVYAKDHWMLAVLRAQHSRVELYDSMPPGPASYEAESSIGILLAANTLSSRPRRAIQRCSCPKQDNGVDCGVLCLATAAHIVAGEAIPESLDAGLFRLLWQVLLAGPGHGVGLACPPAPTITLAKPPQPMPPRQPSMTDAGHLVAEQAQECIRTSVQHQHAMSRSGAGISAALDLVEKLGRLALPALGVAQLLARRKGAQRVLSEVRAFEASAALRGQAQREVDDLDRALEDAGHIEGDGRQVLSLAVKAAFKQCAHRLIHESVSLRDALKQAQRDEEKWRGVLRLLM